MGQWLVQCACRAAVPSFAAARPRRSRHRRSRRWGSRRALFAHARSVEQVANARPFVTWGPQNSKPDEHGRRAPAGVHATQGRTGSRGVRFTSVCATSQTSAARPRVDGDVARSARVHPSVSRPGHWGGSPGFAPRWDADRMMRHCGTSALPAGGARTTGRSGPRSGAAERRSGSPDQATTDLVERDAHLPIVSRSR